MKLRDGTSAVVLFLMSLGACHRDGDASARAEAVRPRPSESSSVARSGASQPVAPTGSEASSDPTPASGRGAVPEDTLIQMERTACFGECARYWVSIQADGTVFFNDQRLYGGCGMQKASQTAITKLVNLIRASGYFRMKAAYHAMITDHPDARLSITLGGRTHRVLHQAYDTDEGGQDPDDRKKLSRIEAEIDGVASSKKWIANAATLPMAIPFTTAQVEETAARNAAQVAAKCPGSRVGHLEIGITIDANHSESDPEYVNSWHVSRATGMCSIKGRHPAGFCACEEVMKWSFPTGCGQTQVSLRFDFGSSPPKVQALDPKVQARTRPVQLGRGGL